MQRPEESVDTLRLELKIIVSCHVVTGNGNPKRLLVLLTAEITFQLLHSLLILSNGPFSGGFWDT